MDDLLNKTRWLVEQSLDLQYDFEPSTLLFKFKKKNFNSFLIFKKRSLSQGDQQSLTIFTDLQFS